MGPFHPFVLLLSLDRERGDGPCLEALQADGLHALLAIAIGACLDSVQRGVDLGDQLASYRKT